MREYTNIKDYSKGLKEIYNKYRETYKIASQNQDKLEESDEKAKKRKELWCIVNDLTANNTNGKNSQKIQEILQEIQKLD